ncbi:MAG: ABC transporter permease [Chthoniobacterales bacterium]
MDTFMNDIRYAFRQLVKHPSFTLIAIFALALGIGANTAIFSVVNAVLLRPLPYPEPEKIVQLRERSNTFDAGAVGYPNWVDWRAAQRSFTDIALARREGMNFSLSTGGTTAPERLRALRASSNFLSVIGLKPRIGRDLAAADDVMGAPNVVLISDRLWKQRFGASVKVLGQQAIVDGTPREIVGVLPPDLRYGRDPDVLAPLAEIMKQPGLMNRGNHPGFVAIARLKQGVTLEQAKSDLDAIALDLEHKYPETNTGRRLNVQPLFEAMVGEYRHSLNLLLAAVVCVLLIACANVANLQLARALARGKEMAVRAALGASRWRLSRQLFAESTILAVIGASAGVLLTLWSLDAIIALAPPNVTRFKDTNIDLRALCFTGIAAVAAGIVVGVWPAWRISRAASLSLALHEVGGRGSSDGAGRQRTRSALVVVQVALAIVLLAGAGLTLKSFWAAQHEPLGFDPHGVVTMEISLPRARYDTDDKQRNFWNQLLDRVRPIPGIESAAIGNNIPFDDTEWDSYFHLTGTPADKPGAEPSAEMDMVSADYFRVLGMPILRGRGFGPQDQAGAAKAVIIDQSFAEKFFRGKDPIGQQIDDNQTSDKNPPPLTVIGVVPRTRNDAPGEPKNVEGLHLVEMYLCANQHVQNDNTLLLRTKLTDMGGIVAAVKKEVQALDPDQPIAQVSTMENNLAASLASRRLMMALLGTFAVLALLLATVGLYGVMALTVAQRTRELGIRMALGAARASIFRLVLAHGMSLIGVGVVLGLIGAIAVGRALMSLLYGVGALDAGAVATAVLSLGLIALIACCVPARRATRVDPIVALREE